MATEANNKGDKRDDIVGDYIDDGMRQNLVMGEMLSSVNVDETRHCDESNRLESQEESKDDNAELISSEKAKAAPTTNLHTLGMVLGESN